MSNHPCLPRTVLVLLLKVSQPKKRLSLRQTRTDVHPPPPTAISPSRTFVNLGCIHFLLIILFIFQGHSYHIHALQPLSHTVKQTRALKRPLCVEFSVEKRTLSFIQSPPSFLFGVPIRSTSLLVTEWIKMIMAETENMAHLSAWRNSASLGIFKMLNSKNEGCQRKRNYTEADNSVCRLLRLSFPPSPPSGSSH